MSDSDIENIGKAVLDAAFHVHSVLGSGLLESVYEAALAIELTKCGLNVKRQKPFPVNYDGHLLEVAFPANLIVSSLILAKLKSVETMMPLFKKTVTNYLKLIPLQLGFLINFNEAHLRHGITRITNGLEGKEFFGNQSISDVDFKKPSFPSRPSRDT
jgi:GxxExxY protein